MISIIDEATRFADAIRWHRRFIATGRVHPDGVECLRRPTVSPAIAYAPPRRSIPLAGYTLWSRASRFGETFGVPPFYPRENGSDPTTVSPKDAKKIGHLYARGGKGS